MVKYKLRLYLKNQPCLVTLNVDEYSQRVRIPCDGLLYSLPVRGLGLANDIGSYLKRRGPRRLVEAIFCELCVLLLVL